jgi:predicted nucleotidyltransferase
LKKLKPELNKKYYVKNIGIFGSLVRGQADKSSDVDILVDFSRGIDLFDFIALENYLSEKTGAKIDLVSAKAVRDEFKDNILKEVIYI